MDDEHYEIDLAKAIADLTPEQRVEFSRGDAARAQREHKIFQAQYLEGRCYLCAERLDAFQEASPCVHWLLKPPGFRKKHFALVVDQFGLFQMQSFLRWIASEDGRALHISDTGDLLGDKLVEVTIRYRELEWSFSCGLSDFRGHRNSAQAFQPHYHFQMRVQGRPFINYNDFHVSLRRDDLAIVNAIRANPETAKQRFTHGESIDDVLQAVDERVLLESRTAEPDEAPLRIQTFLMAEPGQSISGDDIQAIIDESRATGATIASLVHRIPGASARFFVSEGPGAVEPAPRSGGRGAKS